jgi:hypothetical protein
MSEDNRKDNRRDKNKRKDNMSHSEYQDSIIAKDLMNQEKKKLDMEERIEIQNTVKEEQESVYIQREAEPHKLVSIPSDDFDQKKQNQDQKGPDSAYFKGIFRTHPSCSIS